MAINVIIISTTLINTKSKWIPKRFIRVCEDERLNTIETSLAGEKNCIIVVRPVFREGNKYYPQVFLDECLHKLQLLEYDRVDVLKELILTKPMVWATSFKKLRFQRKVCYDCHDLM